MYALINMQETWPSVTYILNWLFRVTVGQFGKDGEVSILLLIQSVISV